MKSLKEHLQEILEAQERIGKLPFSRQEFADFINVAKDYDDEAYIYGVFRDKIISACGEKVWNGFKGWIEGSWYSSDPNDLYDLLERLPKNRLDRVLGAGSYGIVLDLNDKVIKWFHKNTPMENRDRKFYEYCLRHRTSVFPEIYKVGKNFVIMEKLKTGTQKCKLYDQWIGFSPKYKTTFKPKELKGKEADLEFCVKNYEKYSSQIDDYLFKATTQVREIFDWLMRVRDEYWKIFPGDGFGDLREANIGERNNGDMVWFDI